MRDTPTLVLPPERLRKGFIKNDVLSLPSHDALAQILSLYLQNDPLQEQTSAAKSDHPTRDERLSLCVEDPSTVPLATAHAQEVQRYRGAMRHMAADLISLRAQLEALQTENGRLHAHHDPGLELLRDTDLDVMTKTEMADRIASLARRLSNERSKAATQTDRIQQLQNQLIRKNDSEKELLKLKSLLQTQPGHLQQDQRRVRELEAMVRRQGKAIEKMERAQQVYNISMIKKQRGNIGQAMTKIRSESESKRRPAAENPSLSQELHRAPTLPAPPFAPSKATASVKDREDLLAELKRTDTRRLILEQQLEENSKLWGKQKQQMLIHLSEHRYGLGQTSSALSQK